MAKKKDNTFIYIGAAALIYFLLIKKKKKRKGQVIVEDSEHVEFLPKRGRVNINKMQLDPIIDKNDYFKQQYQESLNACSY